MALSLTKGPT